MTTDEKVAALIRAGYSLATALWALDRRPLHPSVVRILKAVPV